MRMGASENPQPQLGSTLPEQRNTRAFSVLTPAGSSQATAPLPPERSMFRPAPVPVPWRAQPFVKASQAKYLPPKTSQPTVNWASHLALLLPTVVDCSPQHCSEPEEWPFQQTPGSSKASETKPLKTKWLVANYFWHVLTCFCCS